MITIGCKLPYETAEELRILAVECGLEMNELCSYLVARGIGEMKDKYVQSLIKRDELKKLDYFEIDCGDMSGYCPNCGREHEGTVGLVNFSFCPDCGQRLDWGEE